MTESQTTTVPGIGIRFIRYHHPVGLSAKEYVFTLSAHQAQRFKVNQVVAMPKKGGGQTEAVVTNLVDLPADNPHSPFPGQGLKKTWDTYERRLNNQHRHQQIWVHVLIPNGQHRDYQLARDLQEAFAASKDWTLEVSRLQGALINVPISHYGKDGRVKLVSAKIERVDLRNRRTRRSELMTRSQFYRFARGRISATKREADFWNGLRFLEHDYGEAARLAIRASVIGFVPVGQRLAAKELVDPLKRPNRWRRTWQVLMGKD